MVGQPSLLYGMQANHIAFRVKNQGDKSGSSRVSGVSLDRKLVNKIKRFFTIFYD
jgi:hypothetical protein